MFKKLKGKVESSILYSRIDAEMYRLTQPVKNKVKKEIAYAKEHPVKATVNVATTALKVYATAQATTLPNYRMLCSLNDGTTESAKTVVKKYISVFGVNYAAEKLNDYNNKLNNKNSNFNAVNNVLITHTITNVYKCGNNICTAISWENQFPNKNKIFATKELLKTYPDIYAPEIIDVAISTAAYSVNKSVKDKKDEESDIDFDKLLPFFNNN